MIVVLQIHAATQLPDADTDVLIWHGGIVHSELGAYVGHDDEGPMWVNAQGEGVEGVTYWAEMPQLQVAAAGVACVGDNPALTGGTK
jgi:hypothetical protein